MECPQHLHLASPADSGAVPSPSASLNLIHTALMLHIFSTLFLWASLLTRLDPSTFAVAPPPLSSTLRPSLLHPAPAGLCALDDVLACAAAAGVA